MSFLQTLHTIVWGPWTLLIFLITGILFTIRSGCFQIRGFPVWWRHTAGKLWSGEQENETGQITQLESACTALAATLGTGNLAGVATALSLGGPGAIFWMWICAGLGMATAYAETSLGRKYRKKMPDGSWSCGPMVVLEQGAGLKVLGLCYALFAVMASLGMGSMVQSNSMQVTLDAWLGAKPWIAAVAVTLLVASVILGGAKRIAAAAQRLMPLAAGIYLLFSLMVLISCIQSLPAVLWEIVEGAFSPGAAAGGFGGILISDSLRYGMARGVFSNEAGLGTLAVLHGGAEEAKPEQQGMWAMFEVFLDTMVICTLTALVILCVRRGETLGPAEGAALTAECFSRVLGKLGEVFISVSMLVFAFATIIAWYYLGLQAAEHLLGCLGGGIFLKAGRKLYRALYLGAVFAGCVSQMELVWTFSDIWNGLMAYPNIAALWLLAGQVHFPDRNAETRR